MSLSTRLAWTVIIWMACTAALGGAAIIGLRSMSGHFDTASHRHDQLRSLYQIGHDTAAIRTLVSNDLSNQHALARHIASITREVEAFSARGDTEPELAPIIERVARIDEQISTGDPRLVATDVNAMLNDVAHLAGDARTAIVENRHEAADQLAWTIRTMAIIFAATLLTGLVLGFVQHRWVARPMRSLARGVEQRARGDFADPVPVRGAREFRQLAVRFNQMSGELDRLHSSMQQQIEIKSRQLIRSEQLASVGHLAAGVAHEINNPLGIITGYAESTLKRMRSASEVPTDDDAMRQRVSDVLQTICDEAFRCRDITTELLELARPRAGEQQPLRVADVVRRAATLVGGLAVAQERSLSLAIEQACADARVVGDESQLVQVLINLMTNALEACEPGGGRVDVSIKQETDGVLVRVRDNGCGMTTVAMRHAFDPFFTDKPQRGLTGTGLGLSVSHAIAERHGGRLHAVSDGPGCGSIFTLELPVMTRERMALDACA